MVRHGGFICRRIGSYLAMLVPFWFLPFHFASMLVPFWFQGPGTKILVPPKKGELERRSLSKICEGARGAAGPPPGCLGGWKPPRNCRGSGGRQPPSKNNSWQLFSAPCRAIIFSCQYFPCRAVPRFSVPGRAKIFRAVPCHKYAGPRVRAVPERPCSTHARLLLFTETLNDFAKLDGE